MRFEKRESERTKRAKREKIEKERQTAERRREKEGGNGERMTVVPSKIP